MSAERARNRVRWANLAYQGNLELIDAALKAYDAVPLHIQHRIKQVDAYVREHNDRVVVARTLLQYFSQVTQISRRSPDLIKYVFSSDSFFNSFLEQVVKKGVVDEQFVGQLEGIVRDNANPYAGLYGVLVHEPRIKTPKEMISSAIGRRLSAADAQVNGNNAVVDGNAVAEGVVYRVAILGMVDSKRQTGIKEKLTGQGIEPVFVSPELRGIPPDCDGVLIALGTHLGENVKHSGTARGYYEDRGYPVRVVSGYGAPAIIRTAIEFRNDLFVKREKLSA